MKGDFSRLTDDPEKHYSGVLMQQGRVQLDADWNEQQAITQRRIETEARDFIGPCGAPKDNAGFQILVNTVNDVTSLVIGKGRYYVDGILCENEEIVSYAQQPYLINPPDPKTVLTAEKPVGILYLDVWQRHITALDDPHIREDALGGPDTATRLQTVWQVKVLPVQTVGFGLLSAEDSTDLTPDTSISSTGQGEIVIPEVTSTNICGIVTAFSSNSITIKGESLTIAAGVVLTGHPITVGANMCLTEVEFNANDEIIRAVVTISQEADVAPRPDGSGAITIADFAQIGRFAAKLDLAGDGSEFQRADCAPRSTRGDGKIGISDWVQAGRYAAGLDPPQPAGGPTIASGPAPPMLGGVRTLRAVSASFNRGTTGSLRIELDSLGDENALGFTLNYNHTLLTSPQVSLGSDVIGGLLNVNASQVGQGVLGIALALPVGQSFAAGTRQLVTVNFSVLPNTNVNSTEVRFSDQLLGREVADKIANLLSATYNPATITLNPPVSAVTCDTQFPEWDSLIAPRNVKLNARTQTPSSGETPCQIPPSAGYQRLENQLYRVEIHKPGALNAATFVWSRDNGTVVTTIDEVINGQVIRVHDVGPDNILGFASGQLVEITDDRIELNGTPGPLFKILEVNAAANEITLDSAPSAIDALLHPKLRRWDSNGEMTVTRPMSNDDYLGLEGGIEVQFSDGDYQTGDYWLIPARTATGRIEWPSSEPPDAAPVPQPPLGIKHHYCRLALIQFDGQDLEILADCRHIFCPLPSCQDEGSEPGIHITDVHTLEPDEILRNDTDVLVARVVQGIRMVCDEEVDNASVNGNPTCFVSIEMPERFSGNLIGFRPLILDANVTASAKSINWVPTDMTQSWLRDFLFNVVQPTTRVLARLTLKGRFIWGMKNVGGENLQLYLDGEAFGISGNGHTELLLPSGDGRRGGDFEMWFWLVNQCPTITINPATLPDGAPGAAYSKTLTTTDGTPPYNFAVVGGALPSGLTLSAGGSLSGILTQSGTFTFTVRVTDQNNCVGDRTYTVMICQPPAITTQPTSQTVSPGAPVNFSITATGTSLSYQWCKNGVNVPGATSSNYTINAAAPGDAGSYHVVVTGACGSVTSNAATLTVNSSSPPTIVTTSPGPFGDVCPGSFKDSVLKIHNTGGSDLIVNNISSSSSEFIPFGISDLLTIPPAGSINVTIRFQPTSFGNKNANITISSNDPATPTKLVSVTGVAPPPITRALPNPLNFGQVLVGATTSLNLQIRNDGNCDLSVTSITLSPGDFTLDGVVRFPLPPISRGSAHGVSIIFKPSTAGSKQGTIEITSNEPGVSQVNVTGTGVMPPPPSL